MNTNFETKFGGGKAATVEWYTARKCLTKEDDGLVQDWKGFVFLNPPYSNPTIKLS